MYSSLIDAAVNTPLVLVQVTHPNVEEWLKRLGLFVGSSVTRHDKEFRYHPVRVRGKRGNVVIPAGLAAKIYVHLDSGEKIPLAEMKKKDTGHIELFNKRGRHMRSFLDKLGLDEEDEITFLRALPHMDYITLVNPFRVRDADTATEGTAGVNRSGDGQKRIERTRLSEGEAARIWGHCDGTPDMQYYFAPQNTPFEVREIMGSPKVCNHLKTHGVTPGVTLRLETIEQSQVLHAPRSEPVTISSKEGLRLYLSPEQAEAVIVKSPMEERSHSEI